MIYTNEYFPPGERYAMAMLILQENAGLTFKEARAFLAYSRESNLELAVEWGVTIQAISNLCRRAERKIEATGQSIEEILGEDNMPGYIDVEPPQFENLPQEYLDCIARSSGRKGGL